MKKLSVLMLITLATGIFSCEEEPNDEPGEEENQIPTCTIQQPEDGASFFVGETVTVMVTAEDEDGTIEEVRFYVDDAGVAAVESFPYNYQWSTEGESAGQHVITAEAIDNDGGKASDMLFVEIIGTRLPVADFVADTTSVFVEEEVSFTDLSREDPDTWLWDFGDGNTSAEQHPRHGYALPGAYSVKLVVSNEAGADSITKEDYIVVSEETVDEATVLVEYLESAEGGDYANTKLPSMVTAEHVKTMNVTGTSYIIDIRSAADYASGHIQDAVNVPVTEVLDHLEGTTGDDGKDIHVVCYTGQVSCWLTTLLQLSGYDNAYSMKFGMCAWHQDFASSWNANISSWYRAQFVTDPASKDAPGDLPVLTTGYTSDAQILQARIQAVLSEGFGAARITSAEAFEGREYFYIVNYFQEADYTGLGHIPGAVQYTPRESMRLDTDLTTLPTDRPVVIYGWTGQASAAMAAYLRVIGYDAQSLLFGVNGMIYDDLESNKWSEAMIMGYDYVTE